MSRDFNRVILVGRLAKDPEIKSFGGSQKAARFTLCTGREWKNKQTGEPQKHTDFISVTVWGGAADVIERYTRKGSQILVEGRISTRDYEDKTGARRYVTEVTAENILLLGGQQSGGQSAGAQPGYGAQAAPGRNAATADPFADNFPLDFSDLGGGDGLDIPF